MKGEGVSIQIGTSSCLVLFCLALSCLVLSCRALSCLVLSCLVLSCLVLSCLVLSCLVLSCLVLSEPRNSGWMGVCVRVLTLTFNAYPLNLNP